VRAAIFLFTLALGAVGCMGHDADRHALLWPGGAPGAKGQRAGDKPELWYYLPPPDKATGMAVIVAPGGSYAHTGGLRVEAFPTARWLVERGIAAVVLRYRVGNDDYHHREYLADGQRAVRVVRSQAAELGVDPRRIGMIGYSAGGHLAGWVGSTCKPEGDPDDVDPLARFSCRPDFVVMVYPVVTLDDQWAHQRSKANLLGQDRRLFGIEDRLSIEKLVDRGSPPAFLVHSRRDAKVLFHNSELFYAAMEQHGRPAELHLYDDGRHGVGLAKKPGMPQMHQWPEQMLMWLRGLGLL
jgi:acetyl esterase/lipase